jgi:tRNA dimethylallyltransferase
VRALREQPQLQAHSAPLDLPAIRAVGYRQAWEFLSGQGDADAFRERAIAATRQLAKRQWTWLRGEADALWCDPATDARRMERLVAGFLG